MATATKQNTTNYGVTGTPTIGMTPEQLAEQFHTSYGNLAPAFGYDEVNKDAAVPWNSVPNDYKNLMIAVSREVLTVLNSAITQGGEQT